MKKGFIKAVKSNKLETGIIFLIIALTLFLRLYRINEYMTFLGDEGRDALVVRDLLLHHHFPFIGPPTSVGNMYNGPLYYYMMAVAMAVGWLNPLSAAVMVALIGTISVGLIYFFAREWFNKKAAVVSSLLYAFSPVTIIYSRSSWNPNPAPFFGLLSLAGVYFSRKSGNYAWLILSGAALAFAIQMHYLALILVPVIGLLWLFEVFVANRLSNNKKKRKHLVMGSVGAVAAFLLLMSPLALFDLKHNFINFRAMQAFFFGDRATTVNLNILNTFGRFPHIIFDLLIRDHFGVSNPFLIWIIFVLLLLPILWQIIAYIKNRAFSWPIFALALTFIAGICGLALYKQTIYDHYLSFFNPVPFLLLGANFKLFDSIKGKFSNLNRGLSLALILLGIIIVGSEIYQSPLRIAPNNQLQKTQEIAHFLIKLSDNKPFNFALISAHNYDAAYQFYLDQFGHKPAKLPFTKTDQLLVVCEDKVCNPVGNPKEEIADFGWTQIAYQTEFDGVRIYKLIHYQAVQAKKPIK